MKTISVYDKVYKFEIPEEERPILDEQLCVDKNNMTSDEYQFYKLSKHISENAKRIVGRTLFYTDAFYISLVNNFKSIKLDEESPIYVAAKNICKEIDNCRYLIDIPNETFAMEYEMTPRDYSNIYDLLESCKVFELAFRKFEVFHEPSFRNNYFVKPSRFGMTNKAKPMPIHDILYESLQVTFQNKVFNTSYKDYCDDLQKEREREAERQAKITARKLRKEAERAEKEELERQRQEEIAQKKMQEEVEKQLSKPTFEERVKNVRVIYSLCNQFVEMWDTDRLNLKDIKQVKIVEANLQTMLNRLFSEEKGIGAKLLTRDDYGNVAYAEDGFVALNEENVNEENISRAEELFNTNVRDWIENIDPDLK